MSAPQFLKTPQGRTIAYHKTEGTAPCLVFLGGLKSDMEGTKATHLEAWAKARGQAFLRFDYSGHGQSSGTFSQGCIGDWAEDTKAAVLALTEGPVIVVGSSMGGWQALLLAKALPDRVAGMVGIAAAPDFTEDGYLASFTDMQKQALKDVGFVELPSDYMEPYIVTQKMIDNGRENLVLRSPLVLNFPVRLLQGTEDTAVSTETAVALLKHAESPDLRLTICAGKDHSFSDNDCLKLIILSINEVIAA